MPSVVVPKDMQDIEMSAVIIQRAARAKAQLPKSPIPSFKEKKAEPSRAVKEDERKPAPEIADKSSEASGARIALPPICPPAQ